MNRKIILWSWFLPIVLFLFANCDNSDGTSVLEEEMEMEEVIPEQDTTNNETLDSTDMTMEDQAIDSTTIDTTAQILAKITAVTVSGMANSYTFNVTIESPDLGCEQYADWWEVVGVDSVLRYRRILTHSHVDEQPFTRSGGPVPIDENKEVIVRAHINNLGYGIQIFKGTVGNGFKVDSLSTDFAIGLDTLSPLPTGCAF